MPQKRDGSGRVLAWSDVYGQFADAAAAKPQEDIDRQLAAMGYDLDKVRGAAARLGRRPWSVAAEVSDAPWDGPASASAPPASLFSAAYAVDPPGRALPGGGRGRKHARDALACMVGAAIAMLVVWPLCNAMIAHRAGNTVVASKDEGRRAGAEVKLAEAHRAGAAADAGRVLAPDESRQNHRRKVPELETCAGADFKGPCGMGKHTSAGAKSRKQDGKGGAGRSPKIPDAPRLVVEAPGHRAAPIG